MDKHKQQALQVAKEIVVKFIEVGRVSPQNIGEIFPTIYDQVLEAITRDASQPDSAKGPAGTGAPGDSQGS